MRDEIIRTGNKRMQAVIDRCRGEIEEIERQRTAALGPLPGVAHVLERFMRACDRAATRRTSELAAADAAMEKVGRDAATERYDAVGTILATAQAAKQTAERTRDAAVSKAEDDYNDALREADAMVDTFAAKDAKRREAKAIRDAAVRAAERKYAQDV